MALALANRRVKTSVNPAMNNRVARNTRRRDSGVGSVSSAVLTPDMSER
jgi:hypothetical protein